MASDQRGVFDRTGPTFLTTVDWNNLDHRRSITASLVNGVYIHERDRQGGHDALAPPWWESFGFRLIKELVDDDDSSYFGALFEFTLSHPHQNHPGQRPPQYVMAFRGTINKADTRARDLLLDLHLAFNKLQRTRRFQIGIESTINIIYEVGWENIWLAGHSLGSSIALLIGRRMAKNSGIHLESYLFNPPFISAPFQLIKNENIRFGLRFVNSVFTGVVATAICAAKNERTKDNSPFVGLSSWVPYLFVNKNDPICCEYAGYFEHREMMEEIGFGRIGRLATKHSIGSLVLDTEAVHLIPSAHLTIKEVKEEADGLQQLKKAHELQQWWELAPDLKLKYTLYKYQSRADLRVAG